MARGQRNRTLCRTGRRLPPNHQGNGGPGAPPFGDVELKPSAPKWLDARLVWIVAIAIHLVYWISLRTQWLVPLFNDTVHRFGPGADFFALYQAGASALNGQSIYQFEAGATVIPYAYPFRYLPVSAYTAGILLNALPPAGAYAFWLGLCELFLLRNVRLTWEGSGGGLRGAVLCALWLVFTPYFLELWVGQFTFILGSVLFWTVLALEAKRDRAAEGWWVASVLWKPASLLWVPIWIRDRRHWPALIVCSFLLCLNGLYFLKFPSDWGVFVDANVKAVPQWHAGNVGLSGLIYHFTGKLSFTTVRMAVTVVLLGPALWVTFRRKPPVWLLAGIWTVLYFLVYKDVWEHHLTMLLPFLVLALWRSPTRLGWLIAGSLALPSPFFVYDLPGLGFNVDPQPYWTGPVSLLHHSWRVVPLLALYVHWLHLSGRDSCQTQNPPKHAERAVSRVPV